MIRTTLLVLLVLVCTVSCFFGFPYLAGLLLGLLCRGAYAGWHAAW